MNEQDFLSTAVAQNECVPTNSFCPALPFMLFEAGIQTWMTFPSLALPV